MGSAKATGRGGGRRRKDRRAVSVVLAVTSLSYGTDSVPGNFMNQVALCTR